MTSKEITFTGSEGNKLAASLFGDSGHPTVLMLHGGGQTRHSWNPTARRLAEQGWCAITLDQRGHGESEWLKNEHYAHADFTNDVAAVCAEIEQQFGIKPICVGASLGGMSSLSAEGIAPNTMSALVLVDITPSVNMEGVSRIRQFMIDRVNEGFESLDEAADAIQKYMPNRKRDRNLEGLRKNLRLGDDGRYRWHWDPKFWMGSRSVGTDREKLREVLINAAKSLRIPTLLVRGRESELVEEDHVREFLEYAPHAKFSDINGAGHMVAGDRNDIFADAVIEFLKTLPKAAV